MSYLIISFSHKNIDIKIREKLAFSTEEEKNNFLQQILNNYTKEAILLSTCNRVEIITKTTSIKKSSKDIIEKLSYFSGVDFDILNDRADIYDNNGAVHHLFSVASALDSLVIGETQIVGQLKDAFKFSQSKSYCSLGITRIMHYAFKCAAQVRNATNLGTGSVSVASTAVSKAKSIVGDSKNIDALVIGAGQMSELAVKHLLSSNFNVTVVSRNIQRAKDLILKFGHNLKIESFENLTSLLENIPIVISATSSSCPIVTKQNAPYSNIHRYWFDIAVPRDIDDNISLPNLEIFSVDDLQDIVNENMNLRAEQAKTAYSIVSKMSLEFFEWLKSLEIEPVVKNLYIKGNEIIDKKVNKAIKKGFIKSSDEENIRKLCVSVITEYLHAPSKKLKNISKDSESEFVINTIQEIFSIHNESNL